MFFRHWLAVAVACFAAKSVIAAPPLTQEQIDEFISATNQHNERQNVTMRISGMVLDEQGSPIAGVRVDVDISVAEGWEGRSERDQNFANGAFQYERLSCSSLRLWFRHSDFHDEAITFLSNKPSPGVIVTSGAVRMEHTYTSQTVVLRRLGDATGVKETDLFLRAEGSSNTAVAERIEVRPRYERKYAKGITTRVDDVRTTSAWGAGFFVREIDAPTTIPEVRGYHGELLTPSDKLLELVLDDAGDCYLQPYDATALEQRLGRTVTRRDALIDMTTAPLVAYAQHPIPLTPSTNYQATMTIPRSFFDPNAPFDVEGGCFYFQHRGQYGKAHIAGVGYRDGEIEVGIKVYIQLDSARRNVAFRH
mgnify:CR=1 FL=1